MLALASPSEAEIAYTPVDNITPNHTFHLDLDGDGTIDFKIHDSFTCTSFCEFIVGAITVKPAQPGNEVWGYAGRSHSYASALPAGVLIGSAGKFSPGKKVMVSGGYDAGTTSVGACAGPWKNARNRYLGLKFMINGETHYGWARLTETCAKNGENRALLTGYAYETTPNKGIVTGRTSGKAGVSANSAHPSTLGRLAQGARSLRRARK